MLASSQGTCELERPFEQSQRTHSLSALPSLLGWTGYVRDAGQTRHFAYAERRQLMRLLFLVVSSYSSFIPSTGNGPTDGLPGLETSYIEIVNRASTYTPNGGLSLA